MRTIARFNIGRGGRFNNPGHLTYEGTYDKGLTDFAITGYNGTYAYIAGDNGEMTEEELKGRKLLDDQGNDLGAEYGDMVGSLDWDGEYDTDVFVYLDEIELDDRYYNAITACKGYVESEVLEYIDNL